MKIVYSNNQGYIENSTGEWQIADKPVLGFDYIGIFFNDDINIYYRLTEGGRVGLSANEISLTTDYLNSVAKPAKAPQTQAEYISMIERAFTQAIQEYLEGGAKEAGYDDIISACSYAGAPNPFQIESQSFVSWRGNVWAYCYQALNDVKTGKREIPTIEKIISELPLRS